KGAYWDAEVKRAQELGLERYPVFTDKRLTDLSYLACVRRLSAALDSVYPQFATHNPVTLACVLALAGRPGGTSAAPARFECQHLHGMGGALYLTLAATHPDVPVRTYAPVGEKRELFAYLVRRLLENSASSSYVRQAARAKRSDDLLGTGFEFLDAGPRPRDIPLPTELHMPQRRIARGHDLGDSATLAEWAKSVNEARRTWAAGSLVNGERGLRPARPVVSPARPDLTIGEVSEATPDMVRSAVDCAHASRVAWSAVRVRERAPTLERLAELILKAGIPPGAFHLLPGDGGIGRALVADPRIAGVAFTGSTATARAIQRVLAEREGPITPLIAETGGLNAMIVDSSALPEQVVDAVVASAFRSAGQRCSSLRVLYLQEEIAPAVLAMLRA